MTNQIVQSVPDIIQGGMGVYTSSPFLVNVVSRSSALGTVSGVAPERVMARILGKGDVGGHYRRALSHFPFPDITKKVLDTFYVEQDGLKKPVPRNVPFFTIDPPDILIALTVCANYAFVYLAKEGHQNPVSINYLEKIAMPHIYAITGAMLADVDFVTMGAGIPLQIPEVIEAISEGKKVNYRVPVAGNNITNYMMSFNLDKFFGDKFPVLKKPKFIPIIASNLLASVLVKKLPEGSVYGFVVEESTAGGHNAPPRKGGVYGPKDEVDYVKIAELGLPFWIGGSKACPEKFKWAKSIGASGIQAGSIFALCEESGIDPVIRQNIRKLGFEGKLEVKTDMRASPTGFPFKVVDLQGSLSQQHVYMSRERVCNQGALRTLYEGPDGSIGYRCPAEPVEMYTKKQGQIEDTVEARCICNGLISTVDLGNEGEPPIITMGDDVSFLKSLMTKAEDSYRVADAIRYIRS